ncbi:desulfoferrodoxin [Candidatus Pacearchaeota archaeon]|nr:desulfoferrodoxin [Candidatus Pacearchaeota archaeon]
MTKLKQIYKCEVCGNIVEVLHAGKGTLVCCGQDMVLQKEQSKGEYAEKHAPVLEKNNKGLSVNIGKVNHPMEQEHYIEWIEIIGENGKNYSRKFLKPNQKPHADFPITEKTKIKKARMYCNVHGLWISEK